MGTTLTGTTPQDTYDSLIKVTDNGPLSGSLKTLTDGLGNDSALALSTGAASITGTLAVSGATTLGVSTALNWGARGGIAQDGQYNFNWSTNGVANAFNITSATGNVGIGTSSPAQKLDVAGTGKFVSSTASLNGSNGLTINKGDNAYHNGIFIEGVSQTDIYFGRVAGASDDIVWKRAANGAEIARIQMNNGGISFNGDTAAANALDDYEEGTFTPTVAFGGGSTGVTYFDRVGNYTKIGRQVTCTMYVALTSKGSDTGNATLEGLPFTASSANRGTASAASISFNDISYGGQLTVRSQQSGTNLLFNETSEAGTVTTLTNSDFTNSSEFFIQITYFA